MEDVIRKSSVFEIGDGINSSQPLNHSGRDVEFRRQAVEIGILTCVLALIATTAIIGNVAVIYAVFKISRLRDQVNYYLFAFKLLQITVSYKENNVFYGQRIIL